MSKTEDTLVGLLASIRTELQNPDITWKQRPEVLTGGFWAQMWRVKLTGAGASLAGELVARVMPNAEVGVREAAVQRHLAAIGFPTPKVHLAAGPGPDLDRAWMLMDLAPGKPLLADLSGVAALTRLPWVLRGVPDTLARHAAALHAVEIDGLETEAVEHYLARLQDQAGQIDRRDLAKTAAWLRQHQPSKENDVICHGDLHPFNILTDPTGDTVLDWSAAIVTDPACDIAYTRLLLANPPLQAPRVLAPIINAAGRWVAGRFVRTYQRSTAAPLDPERLSWFTTLHAVRIVVEVAVWHAQDETHEHANHPFLTLESTLTKQIEQTTGIRIRKP